MPKTTKYEDLPYGSYFSLGGAICIKYASSTYLYSRDNGRWAVSSIDSRVEVSLVDVQLKWEYQRSKFSDVKEGEKFTYRNETYMKVDEDRAYCKSDKSLNSFDDTDKIDFTPTT